MIARHTGGSKNISAVCTNFNLMRSLGFSNSQIVKIAGNRGGANNLAAVRDNYAFLIKLGFTRAQIVTIANISGGSLKIRAIIKSNRIKADAIVTSIAIAQQ